MTGAGPVVVHDTNDGDPPHLPAAAGVARVPSEIGLRTIGSGLDGGSFQSDSDITEKSIATLRDDLVRYRD